MGTQKTKAVNTFSAATSRACIVVNVGEAIEVRANQWVVSAGLHLACVSLQCASLTSCACMAWKEISNNPQCSPC